MNHYIEITIACADSDMAEVAMAYLADYPFDSFDTEERDETTLLKGYILESEWLTYQNEARSIAAKYGHIVEERVIESQNWNATWESESFEPVYVDDTMLIRAPHHPTPPEGVIDIVVAPQMSFGSGHHQTTRMMCRLVAKYRSTGRVLDVGCGTGVLSIAAIKCGAKHVDAVDIDPWSTESATEAARLNGIEAQTNILLGTVECVAGGSYDLILANINRNIILADMDSYVAMLSDGGRLLLSGFLVADIEAITSAATKHGLRLAETSEDDGWVAMAFIKS
ncbi:MAG: 50S ribosomal protein L11 methyltransferase [Alistipes sp.]|nr:50S ribosomal protein L11 methyltransferase [Alistipes sp.]